jgi:hypothetical protein
MGAVIVASVAGTDASTVEAGAPLLPDAGADVSTVEDEAPALPDTAADTSTVEAEGPVLPDGGASDDDVALLDCKLDPLFTYDGSEEDDPTGTVAGAIDDVGTPLNIRRGYPPR